MNGHSDILIIGGGIGGMTAALYAARANLSVRIVEKEVLRRAGELDPYRGKRALIQEHPRHGSHDRLPGACGVPRRRH